MFKREGKIITYFWRPGYCELPPGIEVGAYEYDGDQWQWSRELDAS